MEPQNMLSISGDSLGSSFSSMLDESDLEERLARHRNSDNSSYRNTKWEAEAIIATQHAELRMQLMFLVRPPQGYRESGSVERIRDTGWGRQHTPLGCLASASVTRSWRRRVQGRFRGTRGKNKRPGGSH